MQGEVIPAVGQEAASLAQRVDERIDPKTDCLMGAMGLFKVYAADGSSDKPCPIWERLVVKVVEKGERQWKTILALAGLGLSGSSSVVASPSPSLVPSQCQLTGELGETAQELKSEVKGKYGVEVVESDLCQEANYKISPRWLTQPWMPSELNVIKNTLDKLSKSCFLERVTVGSIIKAGSGQAQQCAGPGVIAKEGSGKVLLCYERWAIRDQFNIENEFIEGRPEYLEQILVHEMAHSYFISQGQIKLMANVADWMRVTGYFNCSTVADCIRRGALEQFIYLPESQEAPTKYAGANFSEDLAESTRLYVTQPELLKTRSPIRYNYVKDNLFCGYEY